MYSHATAFGPREEALLLGSTHVLVCILDHRICLRTVTRHLPGDPDCTPADDDISAVHMHDIHSALEPKLGNSGLAEVHGGLACKNSIETPKETSHSNAIALEPLKTMGNLLPPPDKKLARLDGDSRNSPRDTSSASRDLSASSAINDPSSNRNVNMANARTTSPESDRDVSMAWSAISSSGQNTSGAIPFGRDNTADSALTQS